jgi:Na+/melibiose symporter-like transporter
MMGNVKVWQRRVDRLDRSKIFSLLIVFACFSTSLFFISQIFYYAETVQFFFLFISVSSFLQTFFPDLTLSKAACSRSCNVAISISLCVKKKKLLHS